MLDRKKRYLQIAFNSDLNSVESILPNIEENERILIEAGTPFIKKEGMRGIERISQLWEGIIVADIKTSDGAIGEVQMIKNPCQTQLHKRNCSPNNQQRPL